MVNHTFTGLVTALVGCLMNYVSNFGPLRVVLGLGLVADFGLEGSAPWNSGENRAVSRLAGLAQSESWVVKNTCIAALFSGTSCLGACALFLSVRGGRWCA